MDLGVDQVGSDPAFSYSFISRTLSITSVSVLKCSDIHNNLLRPGNSIASTDFLWHGNDFTLSAIPKVNRLDQSAKQIPAELGVIAQGLGVYSAV